MSRIESLPYSLSNADLKHLLGLALCESGGEWAGQNGARAAQQDEETAPAEQDMTQPMLECRGRASPLR